MTEQHSWPRELSERSSEVPEWRSRTSIPTKVFGLWDLPTFSTLYPSLYWDSLFLEN